MLDQMIGYDAEDAQTAEALGITFSFWRIFNCAKKFALGYYVSGWREKRVMKSLLE